MGKYVVVFFLEPVVGGLVFARTAWPLHITLVRFAAALPSRDLAVLFDADIGSALGHRARAGGDAWFGRRADVPVTLIDPDPVLQRLHEQLVARLTDIGASVAGVGHALEHFRPHVSILAGRRVYPGSMVAIDCAALVDMRPDGDPKFRRILALWH